MQRKKITPLSALLFLAVAGAAAAQTVVAPEPPSYSDTQVFTMAPPAHPVPDPAAAAKCQMVAAANYWDCVNSYHGGG